MASASPDVVASPAPPESTTTAEMEDIVDRLDQAGVHLYRKRKHFIPLLLPQFVALSPREAVADLTEAKINGSYSDPVYVRGPHEDAYELYRAADLQTLAAIHLGTELAGQPMLPLVLHGLQQQGFTFECKSYDCPGKWHRVDGLALCDFADGQRTSADVRIQWRDHDMLNIFRSDIHNMADTLSPHHTVSPDVFGALKGLLDAGFSFDFDLDRAYYGPRGSPGCPGNTPFVVVQRKGEPFPVPLSELSDVAAIEARAAVVDQFAHADLENPRHIDTAYNDVPKFYGMCFYQWPSLSPQAAHGRLVDLIKAEAKVNPALDRDDGSAFDHPSLLSHTLGTIDSVEHICGDPTSTTPPDEKLLAPVVEDWLAMCSSHKVKSTRYEDIEDNFKEKALKALGYLHGGVRLRCTEPGEFERQRSCFMRLARALDAPGLVSRAFDTVMNLGIPDIIDDVERLATSLRESHAATEDIAEEVVAMLNFLEVEVAGQVPDVNARAAVAKTAFYLAERGCEAISNTISRALPAVGDEPLDVRLGILRKLADVAGPGDSLDPYMNYDAIARFASGNLEETAEDYLLMLEGLKPSERHDASRIYERLREAFSSRATSEQDFHGFLLEVVQSSLLAKNIDQALEQIELRRKGGTIEDRNDTVVIGGIPIKKRVDVLPTAAASTQGPLVH